ncbi:MAG: hypothetical protein ABIL05_03125 [candidate division WOR-3 bacterium]
MKWLMILCMISLLEINLVGCSKNELDITLKLSNPQNKAVSYRGYYMNMEKGDSVVISGATPYEYKFNVRSGGLVKGAIYKESKDVIDTLLFQLFIEDDKRLEQSTVNPNTPIIFSIDCF